MVIKLDELKDQLKAEPAAAPEPVIKLEALDLGIEQEAARTPEPARRLRTLLDAQASVAATRSRLKTEQGLGEDMPLPPSPELDAADQQYQLAKTDWEKDRPATATNFQDFAEKSGRRVMGDVANVYKQVHQGTLMGQYSVLDLGDRAAQLYSDVTGFDKPLVLEDWKKSMVFYDDLPDGMPSKLLQTIGALPAELAVFVGGKGAGRIAGGLTSRITGAGKWLTRTGELLGLGVTGGLRAYGDGPEAVARGAAEYMFFDVALGATAILPKSSRVPVVSGIMGGLAAASGDEEEDVIMASAMGMVLASLGPKGDPNLGLSHQIRTKMMRSTTVQNMLKKAGAKAKAGESLTSLGQKVAEAYMKESMPATDAAVQAGKASAAGEVGLTPKAFRGILDRVLTERVGKRNANLSIEKKLDLLIKHVDPKTRLSSKTRENMVKKFMGVFEKTEAGLKQHNQALEIKRLQDPAWVERTGSEVSKAYEKMEAAEAGPPTSLLKRVRNWTTTKWINSSGPLQRQLLKEGGEWGRKVIQQHDAIAGSSAKSQLRFQEFEARALKGLSDGEIKLAGHLAMWKNNIAIDLLKGAKKVRHPKGYGLAEHQAAVANLKNKLGPEKYARVDKAVTEYFAWTRERVGDLKNAGLITAKEYEALTRRNWTPRQFISKIDPIVPTMLGGKKISVPDSGLKPMKKGGAGDVKLDLRELASQIAVRTTNRIAKNNANRALLTFAQKNPNNTIVRLPEKFTKAAGKAKHVFTPKGFVRVDTVVDGQQTPMFINSGLAEQWVRSNPQISAAMSNALRVMSGSAIVRPLATGYNPGFVLTNIPRDMIHVWLTTGEYSSVLPKYLWQLGKDMGRTAKDAWKKDGRYKDFINEGGGMNFLTHQGVNILADKGPLSQAVHHPHIAKIKTVASKLNEFSEIWIRLALRDRAIANGKPPAEATHIARAYLDFAQGGTWAKGIDHVFPYFNAGLQATRGIFRGWKERPVETAGKIMQLMALDQMMKISNEALYPELMAQLPTDIQVKNWIIGTPFKYEDKDGNVRHIYLTIRKDQSLFPYLAPLNVAMDRRLHGRVPEGTYIKSLADSFPIPLDGVKIPVVEAFYTYGGNRDFWLDKTIWNSPVLPVGQQPSQEYDVNTPQIWKDIGSVTNMSPERMQASIGKIVPMNPFTSAIGGGFNLIYGGMTPEQEMRTTADTILDAPIIRRVMNSTHPYTVEADFIDQSAGPANVEVLRQNQQLDLMMDRSRVGELPGGRDSINAFIRSQPQETQKRLSDRHVRSIKLDTYFDRYGTADLPSRGWWLTVAAKNSGPAKAEAFFEEWKRRDSADRRRMETMAAALPGFSGTEFWIRFRQNRGSRGDDITR